MWNYFYIFNYICCINAVTYNTFHGVPATAEEIVKFQERKNAHICLSNFEPCDENEWSRVDGSCDNLEHPTLGMYNTPMSRMLPAYYSDGFEPRKTKSGKDFDLARQYRLSLLKVGEGINEELTTAVSYFMVFVTADIGSAHDVANYILSLTNCCQPEGLSNPMCTPNYVPENDYLHRFTGITCLNMTRPLSFQSSGCVAADTVPEKINLTTTNFDLSTVYSHAAGSINQIRAFEGGRLKVEVVEDGIFPSDANANTTCFLKEAAETGCSRNVPNGLLGTNMHVVWFWRFHNLIADTLAKLNPCWDDETLFNTARDINVAYFVQILYYEFYAIILGRDNLIKEGIIGCDNGFRDLYDTEVHPGLYNEFGYAARWFHGTQDARQRMYDKNDNFIDTLAVVNYSLRSQNLAFNKTMEGLAHGIYMQAAAAFDDTVHPDLADLGLGGFQRSFDILTADLSKGRYFGFAPYSQYRDLCTDYTIKHEKFEDLNYLMSASKIEELQILYEHLEDVELMAGIWSENLMEGAWVPPTVYCLTMNQLKRSVASNRHWYERPNRPHAFTKAQLYEIRKASLAGLLCAVGDGISEIQPQAFLRIGPGNYKVSCKYIPRLDLTAWKDRSC
ncbi:peroxidase [Manduca sexta]|uniref:Peroxidase n=1 Tax=Manduca sexta TaxID=7130 RepID=A0A921ZH07_MANSE|nr:peroxidase [Manduca sexta]KAG6457902.1 hypothetical protein O3G_MSEX010542 [Manduca sexta]